MERYLVDSNLDRIMDLLREAECSLAEFERLNGRCPENLTWARFASRLSALREVLTIMTEKKIT